MKVLAANNERGANEASRTILSTFISVTDHVSVRAFFDSCMICASNQRGKFFSRNRLLPDTFKGQGYRSFSLFWCKPELRTKAVLIQRLHTIFPLPIPGD